MTKLTAVAYYGGIPPNNNNLEKPAILDSFLQGVASVGDTAVAHRGMNAIACDVALIQGFVHEHGKNAAHLKLRQTALQLQATNKKHSLIVDSNLFLYADPGNTHTYLRYSFDGIFPTTGFFFDRDPNAERWHQISQDLGIVLRPWRSQGNHILICLQRQGGWSMGGLDVQQWLDHTVTQIRQASPKRPIVVRTHPGDKKIKSLLKINFKNVKISGNTQLSHDLDGAWATVVYNSSPAVASAVEGIPCFVTDPFPLRSQAHAVSNTQLNQIENPLLPDRQQWIEKLAMCHWKFSELKSGAAWRFFKSYI